MPQEKEEMDAEQLLQELNAKFTVFTAQVLERLDSILELKLVVSKLTESKQLKRNQEAERKRAQRARDREQREKGLLSIPRDIWQRDERIKMKYLLWAHVGVQYGMVGDWRLFLQYIAHEWNTCTYVKKPIAKCSNRPQWWDDGLRHENTWCDMFGSERGIVSKTAPEIKFWDFGFHMAEIVNRMQSLPDWPNVSKQFVQATQIALGDMCELTIKGTEFQCRDSECFEVPEIRYLALHVLQSFKRGICTAVDDDLELIRLGKVSFMQHVAELETASADLRFQWDLRNGKMTSAQMDMCHELRDLGFFEFPKPTLQPGGTSGALPPVTQDEEKTAPSMPGIG